MSSTSLRSGSGSGRPSTSRRRRSAKDAGNDGLSIARCELSTLLDRTFTSFADVDVLLCRVVCSDMTEFFRSEHEGSRRNGSPDHATYSCKSLAGLKGSYCSFALGVQKEWQSGSRSNVYRIYQICEDHTCSREYTPELDDQPKKRGPKPSGFKRASTPVAKVEDEEEERDQLDDPAGVTPVAMPAKLQQMVRQYIEQADLKPSVARKRRRIEATPSPPPESRIKRELSTATSATIVVSDGRAPTRSVDLGTASASPSIPSGSGSTSFPARPPHASSAPAAVPSARPIALSDDEADDVKPAVDPLSDDALLADSGVDSAIVKLCAAAGVRTQSQFLASGVQEEDLNAFLDLAEEWLAKHENAGEEEQKKAYTRIVKLIPMKRFFRHQK